MFTQVTISKWVLTQEEKPGFSTELYKQNNQLYKYLWIEKNEMLKKYLCFPKMFKE